MTEEEFLKKRFKPFELMQYKNDRSRNFDGGVGVVVDCILLSVDFEERLFKLIPIPDGYYEEEEFWARCDNVERPKPKPRKLIVKN